MSNLLHTAFDPENFRKSGHQLIDMLADYLHETQSDTSLKTIPWKSPDEQLKYWQEDDATAKGDIMPLFKEVLENSIHIHHKKYMGHQVVAPAPVTALASLLSSLLNNGGAVYEMGAVSNTIERIVVQRICKAVGWDEQAGGFLTSGGTLANLTALLAARRAKSPEDVWIKGSGKKLALMVSEEAHYCVDRAARVMGWGDEGIIKIPADDKLKMRTDLLEEYLQKAKAQDIEVIAVVGSACTTSSGTYDDLEAIADFCQQHSLWFHVDGAHGGAAAFSPKYRHLVKGMERANSLVIDLHKMMLTPALTTALLFKNESDSYRTFAQQAQYLWSDQEEQEWYNMGKRTMECTKLMMGLKAYSLFKLYGNEIIDQYVTRQYDLGKTFAQMIKKRKDWELAMEPETNIVCFRYCPENLEEEAIEALNAWVRQQLLEDGAFYIVQTRLKNKLYLRTTLMNPFTTEKELNALLERIEEVAATWKSTTLNY
ncbi:pyridoxal phosphate-dependent decarboxylase family protein [Catalinimonas niigatensis]|uniref:pyridoxal phosphate-dependent decarboxylase family protein n=1 Tax=Catalinimonas niigatensis TaxID=1397264 RepID=UPI00266575D4|nr:pyridoxal-dependent decarboxylase [Catalinimonas niigatensis]WPP53149.1 pyridoxal-dependent decarboxylase [Catalinimonas niigatensis]